jgi:glyoxalase family protein
MSLPSQTRTAWVWNWSKWNICLPFSIGRMGPSRALMRCTVSTVSPLWLDEVEPTSALLTQNMGYQFAGAEANRHRFISDTDELGHIVDILHRPGKMQAGFGAGSIHHIAFRVPGDDEQLKYQSALNAAGYRVSPVMDRSYFHSIYFREQGGVLFEIATDTPGFLRDEEKNSLGESLKLPEWYEVNRAEIEASLLPLTLNPVKKVNIS